MEYLELVKKSEVNICVLQGNLSIAFLLSKKKNEESTLYKDCIYIVKKYVHLERH